MGSWHWNDQESPTTAVGVRATMGAVTMKDDPQAMQRPYVFVRGYDSRLHVNWWDGNVNWWDGKAWHWSDQGTPAGRTVIEKVGAITVQDGPNAQQRPYAFVVTDDSKLHVNWWEARRAGVWSVRASESSPFRTTRTRRSARTRSSSPTTSGSG
ncbi:hypothetical protein STRAU_7204 [Streptomyces aurantiacus JA 4570]|uniref:Uncharacterized protein n=1 Tax=Streptomyces aurantiacus JA 4570 TaxID=1286094 RepID=S3ZMW0_9ACTN|nr:hypothetical protein [Streptomyces aurantiacus]EPH39725.1 hypothetical protein STRAU_7204 [Streptomyces aurantiacus JA 4570]